MSTFFRSAALLFLRQTLRSLLGKYLDDVDVEGVALPSLSEDSGWGVRLKNVKLRQGAKLKEHLPGTDRRRRRRQQQQQQQQHRKEHKQNQARQKRRNNNNQYRNRTSVLPLNSDTEKEATESMGKDTQPAIHPKDEADTNSNTRTAQSSTDTTASTSAPTSWFSYFRRTPTVHEPPTPVARNSTETFIDEGIVMLQQQHESLSATTSFRHGESGYESDDDGSRNEESLSDDGYEDDDHDDLPVILRLGKGGTIGVLDVRLVGKDIHVLVEDANVTVEVVRQAKPRPPKSQSYESNNTTESSNAHRRTTSQSLDTSSSHHSKHAQHIPNKQQQQQQQSSEPLLQTIGERVIHENKLARMISMIPNLFLRDIRIRLVLRDDVVVVDDAHETAMDTVPAPTAEYSDKDAIIELSVEFLSVTDGTDPMAKFSQPTAEYGDDSSAHEEGTSNEATECNRLPAVARRVSNDEEVALDFLTKRVKSGRGPDGGITLRVFPGGQRLDHEEASTPMWSRSRWKSSTQFCVLRISGLDAESRIFMGEKTAALDVNASWRTDDNDEYDYDSMLFGGIDYIVPGPRKQLPPIDKDLFSVADEDEELFWEVPGAHAYNIDSNDVLSCGIPSNFHRFARGLTPAMCHGSHLPCEYCPVCWTTYPGIPSEHQLDDSMPMAGLVFHVSLRDTLEINIDRPALETLGDVLALFRARTDNRPVHTLNHSLSQRDEDIDRKNKFRDLSESSDSRTFDRTDSYGSIKEVRSQARSASDDHVALNMNASTDASAYQGRSINQQKYRRAESNTEASHTWRSGQEEGLTATDTSVSNSYPKWMQPEKIQLAGLFVSDISIRIHIMSSNDPDILGSSFCYWDITAKCLTLDQQMLKNQLESFHDIRFDVGYVTAFERKGLERRHLATLGVKQRIVEFDEATIDTLMTKDSTNKRPPWPTIVVGLLDLQVPMESLIYEERDRHAIQSRFVSINKTNELSYIQRNQVLVHVGAAAVEAPFSAIDQIQGTIKECKDSLLESSYLKSNISAGGFRSTTERDGPLEEASIDIHQDNSLLTYRIVSDGGRIILNPRISLEFPRTVLRGERSSATGLSLETMLDKVRLHYGRTYESTIMESRRLSLQGLASLPEQVRLRILLFLSDLHPLERALGLKAEPNAFMRCRSVNKQLVRVARKLDSSLPRTPMTTASGIHESTDESDDHFTSRRQQILNDLLKMDDDQLEDLWDFYRTSQRRTGRRKKR